MNTITLAVLAGGEGRRMGRAKGNLRVGGRGILEHLLERWKWPGPTMLVTAPGREYPLGWERFDREISDPVGGEGPLRGIVTAIEALTTSALVVATCDMPLVSGEQFQFLAAELDGRPGAVGVMLRRGESIEPFPSIYRAAALSRLKQQLLNGRRAVHSLSEDPSFALADAPPHWPAEWWTNLNEPTDLADFNAAV